MKSSSFILIGLFLVLCSFTSATKLPAKSANPWKDDYRDIASLENYKSWGTYNVHDPSCLKIGDTYYMYSTDAIFFGRRNPGMKRPDVKIGNIQVRSSKDLVNWKFEGWAFDSISAEAKKLGTFAQRQQRCKQYLGTVYRSIQKDIPLILLCFSLWIANIVYRIGRIRFTTWSMGSKRCCCKNAAWRPDECH